jgi:nitric oxide reductase NorQ protein
MDNQETFEVGYVEDQVYKVEQFGSTHKLVNKDGEKVGTLGSGTGTRQNAFKNGKAVQAYITKTGKKTYRAVDFSKYENLVVPEKYKNDTMEELSHDEIKTFIHDESVKMKPKDLIVSDLKWKFLVRSAMRAENILMTGPTGCGKTQAAKNLVRTLKRPDFYFNLGATQDPRATLIGNTHFGKESGTYFSQSLFVQAIQTEGAIILLDELTRAHPDAWNILMPVLDDGQRYLRLDEAPDSPTVAVAKGVTFIATANIGTEYTSTRVMDRAMMDRFTIIEMDVLDAKQEEGLLNLKFPDVNPKILKAIAETAHQTRQECLRGDTLTEMISTRASVAVAGLCNDGFTFEESAQIAVLPFFSNDGAPDSERTFVLQIIQKFDFSDKPEGKEEVQEEVDEDNELIF